MNSSAGSGLLSHPERLGMRLVKYNELKKINDSLDQLNP